MSNRNPSTNQTSKPVNGKVRNFSQFIRVLLKKSGMLPALILLLVVGSLVSENFLSVTNISNVLRFAAIIGFISIGQTLVILSGGGGIDLSVASVAAASAVTGALYQSSGSPVVVIVAVSTGVFFGLINGLGVTVGGLQPFIVTLATFTIARGVAFDLTNAQPLYLKSDDLKLLSTGFIGPIPIPIIAVGLTILIAQIILSKTVFGRTLYAVGGNEEAAYASGISIRKYRIWIYMISGGMAGLAGVFGMAQLNTADPNFGNGYELTSIAAVVVGGAILAGGKGSVFGTAVGVLIMALLSNLLNLLNVNPWATLMITGVIIVLVVGLNEDSVANKNHRVWRGLPFYLSIVVGAVILYGVIKR
jgi:hypothetical protein